MRKEVIWGVVITFVVLVTLLIIFSNSNEVYLSPIGLNCPDTLTLEFSAGTKLTQEVSLTHDLINQDDSEIDAEIEAACEALKARLKERCIQFLLNAGTNGQGYSCASCEEQGKIGECSKSTTIPEDSGFDNQILGDCLIIGPITDTSITDEAGNPIQASTTISAALRCGGNDGKLELACVGMCIAPPTDKPGTGQHEGGKPEEERTGE